MDPNESIASMPDTPYYQNRSIGVLSSAVKTPSILKYGSLNATEVYCRFRPMLRSETQSEGKNDTTASISFHKKLKNVLLKEKKPIKYDFDHVFPMRSKQQQLYDRLIKQKIWPALQEGKQMTLIVLGAERTGKTYTLIGKPTKEQDYGLLLRLAMNVYGEGKSDTVLTITMIENDELQELIEQKTFTNADEMIHCIRTTAASVKPKCSIVYELANPQSGGIVHLVQLKEADIRSVPPMIENKAVIGTSKQPLHVLLQQCYCSTDFKLLLCGTCSPHMVAKEETKYTLDILQKVHGPKTKARRISVSFQNPLLASQTNDELKTQQLELTNTTLNKRLVQANDDMKRYKANTKAIIKEMTKELKDKEALLLKMADNAEASQIDMDKVSYLEATLNSLMENHKTQQEQLDHKIKQGDHLEKTFETKMNQLKRTIDNLQLENKQLKATQHDTHSELEQQLVTLKTQHNTLKTQYQKAQENMVHHKEQAQAQSTNEAQQRQQLKEKIDSLERQAEVKVSHSNSKMAQDMKELQDVLNVANTKHQKEVDAYEKRIKEHLDTIESHVQELNAKEDTIESLQTTIDLSKKEQLAKEKTLQKEHDDALQQQQLAHQKAFQQRQQAFDDKIKALNKSFEKQKNDMLLKHNNQLEKERQSIHQKGDQSLENLKASHHDKIKQLQQEQQKVVETLKQEHDHLIKKQEEAQEDIKKQADASIKLKVEALETTLKNQKIEHDDALLKLKQQHDDALKELERDHEAAMVVLKEQHTKELNEQKQQYEEAFDTQKQQLDATQKKQHENEIQTLKQQHEEAMKEQQQKHEDTIKKTLDDTVEKMNQTHEKDKKQSLEEQQSTFDKEKETLAQQFKEEIQHLAKDKDSTQNLAEHYASQIQAINERHKEELIQTNESHKNELKQHQQHHQEEVDTLQTMIDRFTKEQTTHKEMLQHQQTESTILIENLKVTVNTLSDKNNDYKKQLDTLTNEKETLMKAHKHLKETLNDQSESLQAKHAAKTNALQEEIQKLKTNAMTTKDQNAQMASLKESLSTMQDSYQKTQQALKNQLATEKEHHSLSLTMAQKQYEKDTDVLRTHHQTKQSELQQALEQSLDEVASLRDQLSSIQQEHNKALSTLEASGAASHDLQQVKFHQQQAKLNARQAEVDRLQRKVANLEQQLDGESSKDLQVKYNELLSRSLQTEEHFNKLSHFSQEKKQLIGKIKQLIYHVERMKSERSRLKNQNTILREHVQKKNTVISQLYSKIHLDQETDFVAETDDDDARFHIHRGSQPSPPERYPKRSTSTSPSNPTYSLRSPLSSRSNESR